jgi:hypothetical protein
MARDREVASRAGTHLFVPLKREGDGREAVRVPALTEKRYRVGDLERACLRGDSLIRVPEDVLYSHG